MPDVAVCTWPVSYAQCGPCDALEGMTPEERATFEQMASEYLWNWTGRSLGTCPVVLRPCRQKCAGADTYWGSGPFPGGPGGWYPTLIGGQWHNVSCGSCGPQSCQCGAPGALVLPGPVASITTITIDGEVLASTAYRVDNNNLLIRTDGGSWPTCQDLDAPAGEANTFEVSYQRGAPIPLGGQVAAGVLACELAKAACQDKSCALPQRIQSITRQGVSIAVLDSFDDIDSGHTGIWIIDSWVASVTKPNNRAQVYSPDVARPKNRRTTWQPTP